MMIQDDWSDLTYEARTQLDSIIGFSEMLSEDESQSAEALDDLDQIHQAALRVLQLVSRLEAHVNATREQATLDPLTGIANRRFFEERCELMFSQSPPVDFSVVLIDLDKFKHVNDTYGHLVGDDVLKAVVGRCRAAVRDSDMVARLAGDEFVVLLSSAAPGEAVTIAARIRDSVAGAPLSTRKGDLPVTVSVGVANRRAEDGSITDVIERADRAMYRSKNQGRDMVSVAD
ncbi:MAG: diguanylate cyclase [Myxococcota bacterium]